MLEVHRLSMTIIILILSLTTNKIKNNNEVAAFTLGTLLPELAQSKIQEVSQIISSKLDGDYLSEEKRKVQVQELAGQFNSTEYQAHQFVYGELSIPTLAIILDAVGVHENERFLDIGSGDGALVFGTALLYDDVQVSRGLEIVPDLYDRSMKFCSHFDEEVQDRVELHCGDIYECNKTVIRILQDTSLAVCFATTWSVNNHKRKLPKLSKSLGKYIKTGARIVVVDGKLDESDNLSWLGDLKIRCPDTAPYSIAALYEKR